MFFLNRLPEAGSSSRRGALGSGRTGAGAHGGAKTPTRRGQREGRKSGFHSRMTSSVGPKSSDALECPFGGATDDDKTPQSSSARKKRSPPGAALSRSRSGSARKEHPTTGGPASASKNRGKRGSPTSGESIQDAKKPSDGTLSTRSGGSHPDSEPFESSTRRVHDKLGRQTFEDGLYDGSDCDEFATPSHPRSLSTDDDSDDARSVVLFKGNRLE